MIMEHQSQFLNDFLNNIDISPSLKNIKSSHPEDSTNSFLSLIYFPIFFFHFDWTRVAEQT